MQAMFITFEGIDGSGKSSQAALLVNRLRAAGHEVVATREPGGTQLGECIRELLLGAGTVTSWAEACLFAAARAQLVSEVLKPALERKAWVVADRFLDSSLAYQGGARGLGVEAVLELNRAVIQGCEPEKTFLLRVPVDVALTRIGMSGRDRIETEGADFLTHVDRYFEDISKQFGRIEIVDGTRAESDIAEEIAVTLGLT